MKNKICSRFATQTFCVLSVVVTFVMLSPHPFIHAEDADNVFEALQITKYEERLESSDFTLPTVDGEEKSLTDYKGNVVLLNFWTTW